MVQHPISVSRDSYRGSNPAKRAKAAETNSVAAELERYINNLIFKQEAEIQQYMYSQISHATGYPVEVVRRLCFGIDCGHNGFTVSKPGKK